MKGTYCLVIRISKPISVRVGALGRLAFEPGRYVYIGSAMNGLEQRIERHLRKEKKLFWHIDYLLAAPNAKVEAVYYKNSGKKEECLFASKISENGKPVKGFGCSDCRCPSHLYRIIRKARPGRNIPAGLELYPKRTS